MCLHPERIVVAAGTGPVPGRRGFTLIEVVLAVAIAVGLLVVTLTFHQQATVLRGQLLDESERLAAVRQVMDRLAADLRTAVPHGRSGFSGDALSLSFVMADLPLQSGRLETDLRRLTYRATVAGEGTNAAISGLTRSAEPLADLLPVARSPLLAGATGDTNALATAVVEPFTEAIRFLQFRFWDGAAWAETWSNTTPPPGVEISLGFEPLPPDAAPDKYPFEIFRRVIFLPCGESPPAAGSSLVAGVQQP